MKVLVSTHRTQGHRKSDFCFVPENELVLFGLECDRDKGKVDGGCGCRRSMVGATCLKATTTMKVIELDVNLYDECRKSLISAGWFKSDDDQLTTLATKDAEELARIANHFDVGDVIEKRGHSYKQRA